MEVAGAASHEINQPLTVIIKGLEQLIKRLQHSEPEHELAQMILDRVDRWFNSPILCGYKSTALLLNGIPNLLS